MFVWLGRIIWFILLLAGVLFALENRHIITLTLLEETYAVSAYFLFLGFLGAGVLLGLLLGKFK